MEISTFLQITRSLAFKILPTSWGPTVVGLTTGEIWGLDLSLGGLPSVSLAPSAVSSLLLAQGSERGLLEINLEAWSVAHSYAK